MAQHTPFHERTAPLNQTMLWEHWAGFAVAKRYQYSLSSEYYSVRNSVGLFDTSPLFKYRITGPDATALLRLVLARDIATCEVGTAQYTAWCDADGFVLEDGVVIHIEADEYLLTSAGPNLRYFREMAADLAVTIEDISDDYGLLAVQGPHSADLFAALGVELSDLGYFDLTAASVAGVDVTVSRTGYTGDLGYELWAPSGSALEVWDAVVSAGRDFNVVPYGMDAMNITRTEAGLIQINVDFASARFSWIAAERDTLIELGLGWMVRKPGDRSFVGKEALGASTPRWRTVGFEVDFDSYETLYTENGLVAPKDGVVVTDTMSIYDKDWARDPSARRLGHATTLAYSPLLKRHIGLAKLEPSSATPGDEAFLELSVAKRPQYAAIQVTKTPFFDPARKTQ